MSAMQRMLLVKFQTTYNLDHALIDSEINIGL